MRGAARAHGDPAAERRARARRSRSGSRRTTAAWPWALLGLAVLTRVVAAVALGGVLHFPDEAAYVDAAHRLAAGRGFDPAYQRVPGYPLVLALLATPLGTSLSLLRVAQAVNVAAGCALVLVLARRVFRDRRAARVSALAYAVDPLLVVAAGLFYPEAAAAVLLLGAVHLALTAARRDRLAASAAAGLLLGGVAQLRPVALAPAVVVAAWIALAVPARRRLHLLVVTAACALTLLPGTYHRYRTHGDLRPVSTVGAAATRTTALLSSGPAAVARHVVGEFGHFWDLYPTRLAMDRPGARAAFHRADPRISPRGLAPPSLRNALSAVTFGAELLLALVGVAVGLRRQRRETLLLLGVILAYALACALFYAKVRYRITVLPLVFVFTGVGAVRMLRVRDERRGMRGEG